MRPAIHNPIARRALAHMVWRILSGGIDALTAASDCGMALHLLGEPWPTVSYAGTLAQRAHCVVWRRHRRFLASIA